MLEKSRLSTQVPLWPLPHRQRSQEGCPAQVNTEGPAPYNLSGAPRQRNMAQMKEHSKTSELSDEEIANLSDGEFKALVIKMLKELTEFGSFWKMKEQVKDTKNEIKQNIQGTNSEGKETRTQRNNLEQKEEINIQPKQNEERRIQKNEERRRTSGTTLNFPTS